MLYSMEPTIEPDMASGECFKISAKITGLPKPSDVPRTPGADPQGYVFFWVGMNQHPGEQEYLIQPVLQYDPYKAYNNEPYLNVYNIIVKGAYAADDVEITGGTFQQGGQPGITLHPEKDDITAIYMECGRLDPKNVTDYYSLIRVFSNAPGQEGKVTDYNTYYTMTDPAMTKPMSRGYFAMEIHSVSCAADVPTGMVMENLQATNQDGKPFAHKSFDSLGGAWELNKNPNPAWLPGLSVTYDFKKNICTFNNDVTS